MFGSPMSMSVSHSRLLCRLRRSPPDEPAAKRLHLESEDPLAKPCWKTKSDFFTELDLGAPCPTSAPSTVAEMPPLGTSAEEDAAK
jgi:hypothetical protein